MRRVVFIIVMLFVSFNMSAQDFSRYTKVEKDSLEKKYFYTAITLFSSKDSVNILKADTLFRKVVSLNPLNDAAFNYLGRIAFYRNMNMYMRDGEKYPIQNQIDEFIPYLERAVDLDTSNRFYLFDLGQAYKYEIKGVPKAIAIQERIVANDPSYIESYYELAQLYNFVEENENLVRVLNKIKQIEGPNQQLSFLISDTYLKLKEYDKSIEVLKEIDSLQPTGDTKAKIAVYYTTIEDRNRAEEYYNTALAINPECSMASLGLFSLYCICGELDDVLGVFSNKIARSKSISIIKKLECISWIYKKFPDGKDRILNVIHELYNLYSNEKDIVDFYLSYIYTIKDWNKLVEASLAIYKNSANEEIKVVAEDYLGYSYMQLQDYESAINVYQGVYERCKRGRDTLLIVNTLSQIADIYHQKGDMKKTYLYLERALKLNPNEPTILNNYAYFLAIDGKNLKKAYEMSKKSLELVPDNVNFIDTFGWILFLLDRPIEARQQFKQALIYGGNDNAVVLDHYAEVLFKLKEYDLAFIYWNQADRLDKSLGIGDKIKERRSQVAK